MTKPITASAVGLKPHWKVRVVLPNALLHLASTTEPRIEKHIDPASGQLTRRVLADWISDHEYGDTFGFIDWPSATGITWRWSP